MTTQLIYSSFLRKDVVVAVLHTYANQTSVLSTAKFCSVLNKNPDFFALSEKKTS